MKIVRLLYLFFVFGFFIFPTKAQDTPLEDMTFAQMIKSVDLSQDPKAADLIRKFQDLEARQKLMNGPLPPK